MFVLMFDDFKQSPIVNIELVVINLIIQFQTIFNNIIYYK